MTKQQIKNTEKNCYKIIKLPHLEFTVYVKDMKYLDGLGVGAAGGFMCPIDNYNCCLFIRDLKETIKDRRNDIIIAHEIVHILQMICASYKMQMENESEHFAYIMSYVMKEILFNNLTYKQND